MFSQEYVMPFIISFAATIPLVSIIKKIALKYRIVDNPNNEPVRRIHREPIPLLGGAAIFIAFFSLAAYYTLFTSRIVFPTSSILSKHLFAIFLGGFILIIGGVLDDKYKLKPSAQLIFPIIASLVIIASGISLDYITNPFGGMIRLDLWNFGIFKLRNVPLKISLPADIISFFWILGMIYTTKLLDGLDGLTTGITAIGAFVIFGASLNKIYIIPQIALLSIILAGTCCGFLIFNFNPAKIFLGEGGSTLCGFILAALAILSRGKLAVTLLVMGIPILDVVWVISRRLFNRQRAGIKRVFMADREHLHHRLLDAGFSHKQSVVFMYILTASFGLGSLFLQSKGRLIFLGFLVLVTIILGIIVARRYQDTKNF